MMLRRIADRIKLMIGKAILDSVIDSGEIQLVKIQGLAGEVQDGVERIQNYGITSVPPAGGETLAVNIGGNKDHPVVLAVDSGEHRKKGLKEGEVALYDKNGTYIYLKEDGTLEIYSPGNCVVLPDGTVNLGGEILAPTAGVVTGECLDPITGLPFPDVSQKVKAAKV